jgi:hypothetical protein
MLALDKLVPEEEECAQVRSELSKFISEHGVFGNLHVTKGRDRLSSIEWWNMYGSSTTYLHKLVVKVLSQVVNTSSAERCWSIYSFIHSVKINNLNVDWVESLVYVHYNLRLLSHYCEAMENDNYKRDVTWDNNLEDRFGGWSHGLESLEAERLGDHDDGDHIPEADMPPPSTSRFLDASIFPLSSQHPMFRGGH